MRLRLEAAANELTQKGDTLVRALIREVQDSAPGLAEQLEKALPRPDQTLKYPALQQLADLTREQYARTLERIVRDVGKVLDESTKPAARYIEKSIQDKPLEKASTSAGPFIGPRGGKWADAAHTSSWSPEVAKPSAAATQRVDVKRLLAGNAGIPRAEMPQVKSTLVPEFIQGLRDRGIGVTRGERSVSSIKATQSEIHVDKVQAMIDNPAIRENLAKPVIISSDDHLLDGHHRWAALATIDPEVKIETIRVDLPISKLLAEVRGFHGVEFKKADEPDEGFYDWTQPIADRDDRAYRRVKEVLQRKGYSAADFLEGGPLYGYSVNQLIELVHPGRRDDLQKAAAGPFVGPRGGKWADAAHTIPWQSGAPEAGGPAAQPPTQHPAPSAQPAQAPVRVGRVVQQYPEPDWAPGKGAWRSETYSFGGDPAAKKLQSVEWASKMPARWQQLGAYDIRDSLKAALGNIQPPAGHQLVYRIGAGSDTLANRNAGNLEGVVDFLSHYTDLGYDVQLGNQLSVYAVQMPDQYEAFQPYNRGAASQRASKAEAIEFGAVPPRPPRPPLALRGPEAVAKSMMYVGPRGGRWSDAQHTHHWEPEGLHDALTDAVAQHGGKVSQHQTDSTLVMVKLPVAKIGVLVAIKQHFHLGDEVKTGGKYAMLSVPKAVFQKIEAAVSAPKPAKPHATSQDHGKPPAYAAGKWQPHATVEEAAKWAKQQGIDTAYQDVATANQLNRAISEQHPWIQQHVEFLGTTSQLTHWAEQHPDINERAKGDAKHPKDLRKFSLGGSAIAVAHPTTGKPYTKSVVIVADKWGTAAQYAEKAKGFAKGFTRGGELVDTIRHEMGHVEGFVLRHLHPAGPDGPSCWEIWKKHCVAQLKSNPQAVMQDISQYGATNPHECWAEVSVMRRSGVAMPGWVQSAIDEMKIDQVEWATMGKVGAP